MALNNFFYDNKRSKEVTFYYKYVSLISLE